MLGARSPAARREIAASLAGARSFRKRGHSHGDPDEETSQIHWQVSFVARIRLSQVVWQANILGVVRLELIGDHVMGIIEAHRQRFDTNIMKVKRQSECSLTGVKGGSSQANRASGSLLRSATSHPLRWEETVRP